MVIHEVEVGGRGYILYYSPSSGNDKATVKFRQSPPRHPQRSHKRQLPMGCASHRHTKWLMAQSSTVGFVAVPVLVKSTFDNCQINSLRLIKLLPREEGYSGNSSVSKHSHALRCGGGGARSLDAVSAAQTPCRCGGPSG